METQEKSSEDVNESSQKIEEEKVEDDGSREFKIKEKKNIKRQSKINKRVVLWSVTILVILGAVFGMVQLAKAPKQEENNNNPNVIVKLSDTDWVRGNRNASVVLIEYSDFQCPACASYYPVLKKLESEFSNRIAVVYRFFPLTQIHPNALLASQAAQASGVQGKFWSMHDMLFEGQSVWADQTNVQADKTFTSYAKKIGLDITKFKTDLMSKEVKESVQSGYESGVRAQVNYTPTFFLNGVKIQNPRSYEEFRNRINKAINDNS